MDNPRYYEDFNWAEVPAEKVLEKANLFLKIIPKDVKTILDLGCGNGIITNYLADYFEVTGADRSTAALEMVRTQKVQCNCNDLPLNNNSFDLVLSSEMLEHLEDEILRDTVSEIKRVACNYILISVPNSEHIERNLVQCPVCSHVYNMNYHMRSIDLETLKAMFTGWRLLVNTTGGPMVKPSFKWLTKIKHKFAPSSSWIPTYWTKKYNRNSLCPKCSYAFIIPFRHHPVSFVYDVITWLFSRARPYWLIALFEKADRGI